MQHYVAERNFTLTSKAILVEVVKGDRLDFDGLTVCYEGQQFYSVSFNGAIKHGWVKPDVYRRTAWEHLKGSAIDD